MAALDQPITGACLCGEVRYEISEPFASALYCHCTRCQRRSGAAASGNGLIVPGTLTVTAGEELVRCFRPGGDGSPKCFCSNCGSALWTKHATEDRIVGVRLGTVDGDPGVRPSIRQFVTYAAVWEDVPDDGLTHYPDRRPM